MRCGPACRQYSLLLRRSVVRSARLLLDAGRRLTLAAQMPLPAGAACRAAALADSRRGGAVLLDADWQRARTAGARQAAGGAASPAYACAGSSTPSEHPRAGGQAAQRAAPQQVQREPMAQAWGAARERARPEAGRSPRSRRRRSRGARQPAAAEGSEAGGGEKPREPDLAPGAARVRGGVWAPLARERPGWRLHAQRWLRGRLLLDARFCCPGAVWALGL